MLQEERRSRERIAKSVRDSGKMQGSVAAVIQQVTRNNVFA
jgi:hypothetical protein